MTWNSKSSLTDLKARVSPFGVEWRAATARHLSTARDGLDFLTAMRDRDDFWAALVPSDPAAALPVDLAALRAALPTEPLPREVAAEEYLRSVGLSPSEIDAVVGGLDASELIDGAIRSAFEERSPQKIARALERVLDTDRGVLATERYVGRLTESRGIGRTLGLLMGTVILLVGTTLAACGPQGESPTPTRTTPTSEQTEPTPSPGESPETPDPERASPEPPPPEPPPHSTPAPVPAYKGVSPRRRPAPPTSLS